MTWFDNLLSYFTASNALALMLLGLILVIFYIMVRLHLSKESTFDLEDLICDNGKLDEKKFTRFGAWVLSSWGFIYIMIKHPDSLPEWYFIGYMGVWVTNAIMDRRVNDHKNDRHEYRIDQDRPSEPERPAR